MHWRVVLPLVAVLSSPAWVRAQDKAACTSAFVDAQKLRKAGSLVAARDALVTCGQGSCPEIVRDKCVEWLPEVEAEIPTVVLVAKSSAGGDVDGVEVRIDQEGGARSIDGRPIALDPGEHVFEFRHGAERKLERAVLTSRQKDRRIEVTFGTRAEARARTDDAAAAPPARSSAWPLSVYVLGGVGVVALGSFGYFGFTALDEKSSLEDECAPRCTEDQEEGVDRKLLFADISLGVAAVSLGAATFIALSSGKGSSEVTLRAVAVKGGARGSLSVSF